jgi:hypothetical protein
MPLSRLVTLLALALTCSLTAAGAIAAEPAKTLAEGPVIPVLAWAGVPYTQATPERYKELADAGFTHNYAGAANADMMQKLLDLAQETGLKQFIAIPELQKDPEGVAKRFKDHPANGGYYLRDEPGAGLFAELGAWAKRIQSVDTKNPAYVNLFPTYGNPGMWETPDYQTYLERFVAEVPVPMLSFDHYPVIREGKDASSDRLRPDYYHNLELASAAARKANRPLWAFALAVAHNPYPIATVTHMRVQAFSDLAYGAQVMQYFTYWTVKSDVWNFHHAPIEVDGTRTPTYDAVRQVNREIQALRGAFLGSKVVSVGHTGKDIPYGTTRFVAPAGAVKSVETEGSGAVVSMLEKDDQRFLVVVNRDIHRPMPLRVTFDAAAGARVAGKDGSLSPLSNNAHASTVEPGDIVVFAWAVK